MPSDDGIQCNQGSECRCGGTGTGGFVTLKNGRVIFIHNGS